MPVVGLSAASTRDQKSPVVSLQEPTLPAKKKVEEKQEWQVVSRERGKPQAVGSRSPEVPKCKGTNSPIPKGETPVSYAEKLHNQCKKYDPGYEKFEKIKQFEWLLKAKKATCTIEGTASFSLYAIFSKEKFSPSSNA